MANHHGTEGLVKVDAATVAEVLSFTFTQTAEYAEATTLADTDKKYNVVAIKGWAGTLTAFWDETDTSGQVALVTGANIALKLYPEGASSGDTFYSGNALITEVVRTINRGAITEISFNFQGNGALTAGTVTP
jgi:hypothetical protein